MKYVLLIVFILLAGVGHAQTGLKPCKIYFMNQRQYGNMYRDVDTMKTKLKMKVSRSDPNEMKAAGIQSVAGFYKDSAGVRYYYTPDKELWQNINGKILKTVP